MTEMPVARGALFRVGLAPLRRRLIPRLVKLVSMLLLAALVAAWHLARPLRKHREEESGDDCNTG